MISNFFKSKKFFFIIILFLFIASNLLVLKNSFKIKNYIKQSTLFLYYDNYGINFLDYFSKRFSGIFIKKKEININIAFENITKLDNDRKNYLNSIQNLNDMSWVPVVLEFEKKKYKAKIRLKGLSDYHYGINTPRPQNYSYQVKLNKGKTILNMNRFSLMDPQRRGHLNNWIFRKISNDQGLLIKRYDFINLKINGKNFGAYAIDESYEESFFENNKIKFSPIVKFENENTSLNLLYINEVCCGLSEYFISSQIETVYEERKVQKKGFINKEYLDYVLKVNQLFNSFKNDQLKASDIFDEEKLAKWLALGDVFGNWHGLSWGNTRFYYNPFTQKSEPIPDDSFDENQLPPTEDHRLIKFYDLFNRGYFHSLIFKDSVIRDNYFKYLELYSSEEKLTNLFKKYSKEIKEKEILLNNSYPYTYKKYGILENAEKIRVFLNPKKPLVIREINEDLISDKFVFEIGNTHAAPLEIKNISFEGKKIYHSQFYLKERGIINAQMLNPKVFKEKVNFEKLLISKKLMPKIPSNIIIEYSIPGTEKIQKQSINVKEYILNSKFTKIKNIKNLLNTSNEFLNKFKNNEIIYINEPIVIDSNLFISNEFKRIEFGPGAKITFRNNANIISETGLVLIGQNNNPIQILAENSKSCLVIRNSQKISIFKNVIFKNLSNCQIPKLKYSLTGAVNFYNTKIKMDNVFFHSNLSGDDYMNIISSDFDIGNIFFKNTFADALDIDFSSGNIKNLTCINCGTSDNNGDGVDLSFSSVEIANYNFENISDKAVSVGEDSNLILGTIEGSKAFICIASKDGSTVDVVNAILRGCNYGIAVYNKKPQFKNIAKVNIINNKSNNLTYWIEGENEAKIENININKKIKNFLKMAYGKK